MLYGAHISVIICSKLPGVVKTAVGYTGGTTPSPTYETVCGGDGHTEAMRIWFDSSVTSYEAMLEVSSFCGRIDLIGLHTYVALHSSLRSSSSSTAPSAVTSPSRSTSRPSGSTATSRGGPQRPPWLPTLHATGGSRCASSQVDLSYCQSNWLEVMRPHIIS